MIRDITGLIALLVLIVLATLHGVAPAYAECDDGAGSPGPC